MIRISKLIPIEAIYRVYKVEAVHRLLDVISIRKKVEPYNWRKHDWSKTDATLLDGRIVHCSYQDKPCPRWHCAVCYGDDAATPPPSPPAPPPPIVIRKLHPVLSIEKAVFAVRKRLTADVLPGLGFAQTGRISDPHAISDEVFSKAIRGWTLTRDQFTPEGVPLPGLPDRDRAVYEGVLALRGWVRPAPPWATMCLKYPPPVEPEKVVRVKQDKTPHWSAPPPPELYEITRIAKRKVLRVEIEE